MSNAPAAEATPRHLTFVLVWAVVFCDIGTSVYYVPGILYGQVGELAPLFVMATTLGFILLSAKYIEIAWRNPEGGGVVTMATKAFGPWWGCLGGLLITVDYFLTSAISSVSGMQYLGSLFPSIDAAVVPLTVLALLLLASVNVIGIRESAVLSLIMAVAALVVDWIVIGVTLVRIGPPEWQLVWQHIQPSEHLSVTTLLVGFSGAWLAFSGLESISQLSPAMRLPLAMTARRGMLLVVGTILLTAPVLTLFSVALLPQAVKLHESERFISELASLWGGWPVKVAVVSTASALLLFAANTAIIGGYHVFLALAQANFIPPFVTQRNHRFHTPHVAIGVAVVVPMLIVVVTQGNLTTLGEMYAFGLLGAFVLSSAALDVVRWRERQRRIGFWIGLLTTAMVVLAWTVNLVTKPLATFFGGGVVGLGLVFALAWKRGWLLDQVYRLPFIARRAAEEIEEAEDAAEDIVGIVSLGEAHDLLASYPSQTLVAVREPNLRLLDEAAAHEQLRGGNTLYVLFVEERPGLFVGTEESAPQASGVRVLQTLIRAARRREYTIIPVWTVSYNAAEAIARAVQVLHMKTVVLGVSRRNGVYHLLRGHVVNGLARRLPQSCHMLLYS